MMIMDASTLILLAKISLLDLLLEHSRSGLAIPEEVERECCRGIQSLDALLIRKRLDEEKIKIIRVKDKRVAGKLARDFNLGLGEAAAIALALQQKAQLVAIDDKNGINACKLVGMAFTTAVAILVQGTARGWLRREEGIAKLGALAEHGRYARSIITDARERLEAMR